MISRHFLHYTFHGGVVRKHDLSGVMRKHDLERHNQLQIGYATMNAYFFLKLVRSKFQLFCVAVYPYVKLTNETFNNKEFLVICPIEDGHC